MDEGGKPEKLLVFKPYKHQEEAIDFVLRSRNSFLWHEVGLGKTMSAVLATRTALARIRNHRNPLIQSKAPKALIIPPTYLVPQWRSEVLDKTPDRMNQIVYLPYSQLHRAKTLLSYYDVRVIIMDESHLLKNPSTERMRAFQTMLEAVNKTGFRDGKMITLTGTPIPNNASEMYTTWAMLSAPNLDEAVRRLKDNKRYLNWNSLFCQKQLKKLPDHAAKKAKRSRVYETLGGVANPEKFYEVIKGFTHYKTAEECLDLPQKIETFVDLGISDDRLLQDADIEKPVAYMALVERLSQAMAPHAIKWIKDFIDANPHERLVVFCPHVTPLKRIKEHFGEKVGLIVGGESSVKQRDDIKKKYDSGECPIIAGTYAAMSTGYNLQKGFNSLYVNYPWSPKIIRQAQGRTNRSGQVKRTRHTFLMSGENAKKVLRDLRAKEAGINSVEEQFRLNDDPHGFMDLI